MSRIRASIVIMCLALAIGVALYWRQVVANRQRMQTLLAPSPDLILSVADAPSLGSATAKLTLVHFSDYRCQACTIFNLQILPSIQREYIDTNKLRYVLRHFSTPQDTESRSLNRLAVCFEEEKRFWELHNLIFRHPITTNPLDEYSREFGLDRTALGRCAQDPRSERKLDYDTGQARIVDVIVAPAYFIGLTDGSNSVRIERALRGAVPLRVLREAIETLTDSVSETQSRN